MNHHTPAKLLGALSLALCSLNIHAVTIVETYDPITDTGTFAVTNTDGLAGVLAFAVANNTGFGVDGDTTSGHGTWTAGLITESNWDFGNSAFGLGSIFESDMATTFGAGTTQAFIYWVPDHVDTEAYIELPEWDLGVDVFEGPFDGSAEGIFPFVTAEPFGFSATAAGSPCVALLSDGTVESCTTTFASSPVPLPASILLFVPALIGLFKLGQRS